jgi:hypothetical protein
MGISRERLFIHALIVAAVWCKYFCRSVYVALNNLCSQASFPNPGYLFQALGLSSCLSEVQLFSLRLKAQHELDQHR